MFLWFFIDDTFQYHERVGKIIATHFDIGRYTLFEGMRPQDIGEALAILIPACTLSPPIIYAYTRSDTVERKCSHVFALLIVIFGTFSVIIDIFGRYVALRPYANLVIHVEEGGEVFVTSMITAFAAGLLWRESEVNN